MDRGTPPAAQIDYLEGLMEGFIAYDGDWRMTYMNAAAERITGRRREEVLGKTWHEAFSHAIGSPVDLMYQRVKAGRLSERIELYYEHYKAWFEVSASPLQNGGVAVYFQDISARKRTEAELRTLAAVVESSGDFIGLCTPGMVPFYVNEAGRRMMGLEGRDVSKTHVLDYFWPEERPRIESEALPALLRDGRWSGEVRFRNLATGAPIHTLWNAFAIRNEAGEVAAWATISPNLDELKRAEEALQRANAELRESARRKDEFLATLAHELRNPLAPISNAVDLLGLQARPDPVFEAARGIVERQLKHMVRLIDDLLDVSRIRSGKLMLRRERVELAAVIEQALETARPHVRGHEFTVSLPGQPVWLEADPVRLAQVFSNLLNNACKYTPAGGHIRLSAEREGASAVVRVRDDGIGIAAQHLPHVFDMFSQAAPALERAQGGLGIGLALAQALARLHGGAIEAKSDGADRGSEFSVTLPALDEAPPALRRRAALPASTSRRVLIVDDNEDGAASLAMLLRADGHAVSVAHDGAGATEAVAAFKPDVILLDIGLPGMNGYETCRAIRARPGGERIVIAALTGWGQDDDHRRSREAGFDAHLVKPVERDALAALLR
jgi:PAS domain S-box-containing protein